MYFLAKFYAEAYMLFAKELIKCCKSRIHTNVHLIIGGCKMLLQKTIQVSGIFLFRFKSLYQHFLLSRITPLFLFTLLFLPKAIFAADIVVDNTENGEV